MQACMNPLATKMPEKTENMKNILLKLWADIKAEGPNEWWENERQKPTKGGTLSYYGNIEKDCRLEIRS